MGSEDHCTEKECIPYYTLVIRSGTNWEVGSFWRECVIFLQMGARFWGGRLEFSYAQATSNVPLIKNL